MRDVVGGGEGGFGKLVDRYRTEGKSFSGCIVLNVIFCKIIKLRLSLLSVL